MRLYVSESREVTRLFHLALACVCVLAAGASVSLSTGPATILFAATAGVFGAYNALGITPLATLLALAGVYSLLGLAIPHLYPVLGVRP